MLNPISFSININLKLLDMHSNKASTKASVIKAVINGATVLRNRGAGAFSIQQLILDINSARLTTSEAMPPKEVLDPGSPAYDILREKFLNLYWASQREKGDFVLVYNFKFHDGTAGRPTLTMTDMDLAVQRYPYGASDRQDLSNEERKLSALCYLGMTSGTVKEYEKFDWDWITPEESTQAHGVISIRRNAFADWFATIFNSVISSSYRIPLVKFGPTTNWYDASYVLDLYDPIKYPDLFLGAPGGFAPPRLTCKSLSGEEVLSARYNNSSRDQRNDDTVEMSLTYDETVKFKRMWSSFTSTTATGAV
jgi:hypothetical protein